MITLTLHANNLTSKFGVEASEEVESKPNIIYCNVWTDSNLYGYTLTKSEKLRKKFKDIINNFAIQSL